MVDLSTENEKDIFGLPKMTTNQEVILSFGLFVIGLILTSTHILLVANLIYWQTAALGILMMAVGYFFAIETIRELEEKDHVLAKYLELESD